MIDMTLLPEPWRSEFVAICAVSEGESLGRRSTLRIGDLLWCRKEYQQVNADGSARSLSVWPQPPDCLRVGLHVFDEQLYPDLWADWRWV